MDEDDDDGVHDDDVEVGSPARGPLQQDLVLLVRLLGR